MLFMEEAVSLKIYERERTGRTPSEASHETPLLYGWSSLAWLFVTGFFWYAFRGFELLGWRLPIDGFGIVWGENNGRKRK